MQVDTAGGTLWTGGHVKQVTVKAGELTDAKSATEEQRRKLEQLKQLRQNARGAHITSYTSSDTGELSDKDIQRLNPANIARGQGADLEHGRGGPSETKEFTPLDLRQLFCCLEACCKCFPESIAKLKEQCGTPGIGNFALAWRSVINRQGDLQQQVIDRDVSLWITSFWFWEVPLFILNKTCDVRVPWDRGENLYFVLLAAIANYLKVKASEAQYLCRREAKQANTAQVATQRDATPAQSWLPAWRSTPATTAQAANRPGIIEQLKAKGGCCAKNCSCKRRVAKKLQTGQLTAFSSAQSTVVRGQETQESISAPVVLTREPVVVRQDAPVVSSTTPKASVLVPATAASHKVPSTSATHNKPTVPPKTKATTLLPSASEGTSVANRVALFSGAKQDTSTVVAAPKPKHPAPVTRNTQLPAVTGDKKPLTWVKEKDTKNQIATTVTAPSSKEPVVVSTGLSVKDRAKLFSGAV